MGVKGIICGHTPPGIMFRAIRNVTRGELYIDTQVARELATLDVSGKTSPFSKLSSREYEVMRLLVDGQPIKKIAERLYLSPNTVANHHTNILKKLKVSNHS